MLENGAQIDAQDYGVCDVHFVNQSLNFVQNKKTPLHIAVENDNKEVVSLLLEKGSQINALDKVILDQVKSSPFLG